MTKAFFLYPVLSRFDAFYVAAAVEPDFFFAPTMLWQRHGVTKSIPLMLTAT